MKLRMQARRELGIVGIGALVGALCVWCMAVPDASAPVGLRIEPVPGGVAAPAQTAGLASAAAEPIPLGAERVADASAVVAQPVVVRVLRGLGTSTEPYLGPLRVLAGDRVLLESRLETQASLTFDAPSGTESVQFVAPDHAPAALSLAAAAPASGRRVVLQPTTCLRLVVLGTPVGDDCRLHWSASTQCDRLVNSSWRRERDGAQWMVPFVADVAFEWQASRQQGGSRARLAGTELALRVGECRTLTLDFNTAVARRYRLVGPSPELRKHLHLGRRWGAGPAQGEGVTLDGDDSFEATPIAGARWCILSAQEPCPVIEKAHGEEIWLSPATPLIGIGVRDAAGAPQRSVLRDGKHREISQALLHVLPRDSLPEGLYLHGERATVVVGDAVRSAPGDLVWLALPAAALGRVRILPRGTEPTPAIVKDLGVRATQDERHTYGDWRRTGEITLEVTADAPFDLAWHIAGARTPLDIRRGCVAPANGTLDIETEWPAIEQWMGEVIGHADSPPSLRWQRVEVGDHTTRGSDLPLGEAGTFPLRLWPGETLPTTWRLQRGTARTPGTLESVDAVQRRFRLRAEAVMRLVSVQGEFEGVWYLWFAPEHRGHGVGMWRHDQVQPIAVTPGQQLHGAVVRGVMTGAAEVVAWWTIDDGVEHLVVRPANGRTIEVRTTAATSRHVSWIGPHGQTLCTREVTAAAPLRWFAPDGTRGIKVWDGQVQSKPRELPLGAGDVITID